MNMKKIIALLLAASLLTCMGANVSAEAIGSSPEQNVSSGDLVETQETNENLSTNPDENDGETELSPESDESEPGAEQPAVPSENDGETGLPTESGETDTEAGQDEESNGTVGGQEPVSTPSNASMDNPQPLADGGNGSQGQVSSTSLEIDGSYQSDSSGETYYVDVTWSGMSFTYHAESKGKWNPDTMSYDEGGQKAYWSSSDSNGYGTITVTNKSVTNSGPITVSFDFTKNAQFTGDLYMRFSTDSGNVGTSMTLNSSSFTLLASTAEGENGETKSMYVVPAAGAVNASDFTNASNKLGEIKITIKTAGLTDPPGPGGPEIFD